MYNCTEASTKMESRSGKMHLLSCWFEGLFPHEGAYVSTNVVRLGY